MLTSAAFVVVDILRRAGGRVAVSGVLLLAGCGESPPPQISGGPPQEMAPLTITEGDGPGERQNSLSVNFNAQEQRRHALEPGDAAPALSISRWMQGEALELRAGDTVHVVEFWATWCGPCLMSMPHLAELQTRYGDKVKFVGVTDEEPELVEKFLQQPAQGGQQTWGQLLTYRIAVDDAGKTSSAWLQAAGQDVIPCAFIVGRQGKVEWIGHPLAIDRPLQQVVDGTWDIAKGKREEELRQAANEAISNGNFRRLLAVAEQMDPEDVEAASLRMLALFQLKRAAEGNEVAAQLLQKLQNDADGLNSVAWTLVAEVPEGLADLQLARKAAERAVELDGGRDANSLDTLARVHFRLGDVNRAQELQRQALELADESRKAGFEGVLREYESAAGGKSSEK
ncbi:MAG: redoxin family protein [Planctomyces sp.]|jgi:thiol-disulfide isomerase/thioredoxin|nr:redoxin family protein [Planctomyces sp.]